MYPGQWWRPVWSQWRQRCGCTSTAQQKIWRRRRRTWSWASSPTAESSREVSLRSSTTPPSPCCPSSPPCSNTSDRTCSEKTSYVRTDFWCCLIQTSKVKSCQFMFLNVFQLVIYRGKNINFFNSMKCKQQTFFFWLPLFFQWMTSRFPATESSTVCTFWEPTKASM